MAHSPEKSPAEADSLPEQVGDEAEAEARAKRLEQRLDNPLDHAQLDAVNQFIASNYIQREQPNTSLGKLLRTEAAQEQLSQLVEALSSGGGKEATTLWNELRGLEHLNNNQAKDRKLNSLRALSLGWQEYIREQNHDKRRPLTETSDLDAIAFGQLLNVEVATARASMLLDQRERSVEQEKTLRHIGANLKKYINRPDFPQESRDIFQEVANRIENDLPEARQPDKVPPATLEAQLSSERGLTPEDVTAIRGQAQELIRQAKHTRDWFPVAKFLAHAENAGVPFQQDGYWQQLRDNQLLRYQELLQADPEKLLRVSVYLKKLGMQQAVDEKTTATLNQYFEEQKKDPAADPDDVRQTAVFLKYIGIPPQLDDDRSLQIYAADDDKPADDLSKTARQYAQLKYLGQPVTTKLIADAYGRLKKIEQHAVVYLRTAAILQHYAGLSITIPESVQQRLDQDTQEARQRAQTDKKTVSLMAVVSAEKFYKRSSTDEEDILSISDDDPLAAGFTLEPETINGRWPTEPFEAWPEEKKADMKNWLINNDGNYGGYNKLSFWNRIFLEASDHVDQVYDELRRQGLSPDQLMAITAYVLAQKPEKLGKLLTTVEEQRLQQLAAGTIYFYGDSELTKEYQEAIANVHNRAMTFSEWKDKYGRLMEGSSFYSAGTVWLYIRTNELKPPKLGRIARLRKKLFG